MEPWIADAMLAELEREWRALSEEQRPPGAWACQYAQVTTYGVPADRRVLPRRAWFLTECGFAERDVASYAWFKAIVLDRPWWQGYFAPPKEAIFGRRHEIALTSFGELEGTDDWYLGFQWGNLFGHGYRYFADTNTHALTGRTELWIS